MKSYSKFPLYLGLFVLVISVLVSAVKVGENQMAASQRAKALSAGASLSLNFSAPDLVSLFLVADKAIAGVDATVKYEKGKITILPSTLTSGVSFVTSGGRVDEEEGTLSFSALAKEGIPTSPIVATFRVIPLVKSANDKTSLQFVESEGKTAVLEKSDATNILSKTSGVTFSLSAK